MLVTIGTERVNQIGKLANKTQGLVNFTSDKAT